MPWDECRRETTSHLQQNDWIPKLSISFRSMSAATKWTRKIFVRASGCGSGKDRRAKPSELPNSFRAVRKFKLRLIGVLAGGRGLLHHSNTPSLQLGLQRVEPFGVVVNNFLLRF